MIPQSNRRQHAHSTAYTVQEGTFRDVANNSVTVSGKVVRNSPDGFAVTFDEPVDGLICDEGQFPEIVHESDR